MAIALRTPALADSVAAYLAARPDMLADPYPFFHELRVTAPVFSDGTQHVLTRYADIAAVLKDPHLSSDGNRGSRRRAALARVPEPVRTQMREAMEFTGLWMLFSDAPDHTRRRALALNAFTPRRVAAMRERVQRLVDEMLDARAEVGQMDVIAHLAYPLPVTVISDLLGIPDEDRDLIKRWSVTIATFFGAGFRNAPEMHATLGAFRLYLRELIAQRRAEPADDLLSTLVHAEDDGGQLSEDELLGMCILLLFAGHETTTNLIGNGLLALLRHPDQLALLHRRPDLIGSAVEELLRFDPPVQGMARITTEMTEIGGVAIPAGETLLLLYGAANRDPAQFDDPDNLDITRTNNRHLSFAHGAHFCLGAALARLEGQIALGTLVQRFPDLQLATGTLQWRPTVLMRGLQSLPVTFTERTASRELRAMSHEP